MDYSKSDIERIINQVEFEYQQVNLPYGLMIQGRDRSTTSNVIFPNSLEGKKVLDIGCALGYFCYQAEIKGAEKVVGLENKTSRFQQALLIKDILQSNVEFHQLDIYDYDTDIKFDYVLLLNVLHHLTKPMEALQKIADFTKHKLIIEFPTFYDKRFRRFLPDELHKLLNDLPLIGVSSLKDKHFDQTFIFGPNALERILIDHLSAFNSIRFVDSPIEGRMIAFCDK